MEEPEVAGAQVGKVGSRVVDKEHENRDSRGGGGSSSGIWCDCEGGMMPMENPVPGEGLEIFLCREAECWDCEDVQEP